MKKTVVIVVLFLLFVACGGQEYTYKPLGKPDRSWVGKTVWIKFGSLNEDWLKNKSFVVKITGMFERGGHKVFTLAEKYHSDENASLYLAWFGKDYPPQITEWKEATSKR